MAPQAREGTAQLAADVGFSCRCAGTLPLTPPSKDGNIVSSVSSSVSAGPEAQEEECPRAWLPAGPRFLPVPEPGSSLELGAHLSWCARHSGWFLPFSSHRHPLPSVLQPVMRARPGFCSSPTPLLTATSLPSLQVLPPQLEAPAPLGRKPL